MKISKLVIFFSILTLLILTGCSNDDDSDFRPEEVVENSMNVEVNGENYESINENVGGNENCGSLYVSTAYYEEDKIQFSLNIDISKNGQLLEVSYDEYDLANDPSPRIRKKFLTPNYNPLRTFSISNFSYNQETGSLEFSFEGSVFWEEDNNIQRNLSGDIKIKSFKTIDCSIAKYRISHFSNNIDLFSYSSLRTKYTDGRQRHRFYSNNGFILDVKINGDLWNMPLGAIDINENSSQNSITLLKQSGDIVANQTPSLDQYEWKNYSTNGQIIIEEKTTENGHKLIIGRIVIDALQNNETIYSFENIEFKTGSFED